MYTHASRQDAQELSPMQPARSWSVSSDVMSNSTRSANTLHHVPHANPPPGYIAEVEASDLISGELDRKVIVSLSALTLLNEFLDHVLFTIISTSHSVALGQLKAAVPIVLKPRLGKLALSVAEEELKEYIEDEEAEELYSNHQTVRPRTDFDVDLVWKLARLRCMVYARMGDLEEEDEEEWLEKEHLLEQAASFPTYSRQSMAISPGAAIFLTSVIEYLGEQALYYAAQHAQRRHDSVRSLSNTTPENEIAVRDADIVLEGKDMNHIGRDSPLSRLWRSWRRTTRSPGDPSSRPMSPENLRSHTPDGFHSRTASVGTHPLILPILEENRPSSTEPATHSSPSQIPLPMSIRDIEEIEGRSPNTQNDSKRPLSMPLITVNSSEQPLASANHVEAFQERNPLRTKVKRHRSNSLPTSPTPVETAKDPALAKSSQPTEMRDQEPVAETNVKERALHSPQESSATSTHDFGETFEDSTTAESLTARSRANATPEQLNNTVGVIASALGIVGVHHIQQRELQQLDVRKARSVTSKHVPEDDMPLTSASITAPGDFDIMHVPQSRSLSEERQGSEKESSRSGKVPSDQRHSAPVGYSQQTEELVSYSRDVHEMDTPSIYSTQEHSPRFPKDMRSVSRQSDPPDRIESHYAPTPEPDTPYHGVPNQYHALPAVPEIGREQVRDTDSPVSMVSSKMNNKQYQPVPAMVPETPTSFPPQRMSAEMIAAGHDRGHSKSSSSSSRLLGFTRDSSGRPQTIHQQRAAGNMTDEMRYAYSSTPTVTNKPFDASSVPSPQRRQHLRIRSDSGDNVYRNNDDAKHSLDLLIQSDETLHYTLTPPTASFDEEDVDSTSKRTQTQDLADFLRNTAPPGQEQARPRTARSHKASMDAARAPQVAQTPERTTISSTMDMTEDDTTPKAKMKVGVPRDPKVDRMSGVRDLADYARMTGPTDDAQLPKPLATKAASVVPNTSTASVPKGPTASTPVKKPMNRLKFQARDARPSRHAESTALIDFIREGPPREAGDHRIDRNVAPFRTTMDSEDLNALAPSIGNGSSDTNGIRSVDVSTNSQSPLLTNGARFANSSHPSQDRQPTAERSAEEGIPKKTQRRVRDPYAIDEDDDDELFQEAPRQTNEESLIDFLRNTAPSQDMTAQPILSSPQQAQANLNNKPGVDRVKEIIRGRGNEGQMTAMSGARAESPHLTQIGSKLDSYRPTHATHAAHVERNRQKARTEAQNTRKGYGDTADLADYLRNTGPPTNPQQQQMSTPNKRQTDGPLKEEGGGLKKFFSLRGRR